MTLKDLIALALAQVGGIDGAEHRLESLLDNAGEEAAVAVAAKVYKQEPGRFSGPVGEPDADGHTPVQRLAQAAFLDFKTYLRMGGEHYPGAPEIPALQAGADVVYLAGNLRTVIHNWTNAAALALLTNPPTT